MGFIAVALFLLVPVVAAAAMTPNTKKQ